MVCKDKHYCGVKQNQTPPSTDNLIACVYCCKVAYMTSCGLQGESINKTKLLRLPINNFNRLGIETISYKYFRILFASSSMYIITMLYNCLMFHDFHRLCIEDSYI